MSKSSHEPAYWPEQAEHSKAYELRVPPWALLAQQSVVTRTVLRDRLTRGLALPSVALDVPDRRTFGSVQVIVPERFDLRNIFCFQLLPEIIRIKEEACDAIADVAATQDLYGQLTPDTILGFQNQTRSEFAHSLYHHAMWREHGRHVFVLDRTTYDLLAETPLPPLPASILSAPANSFYLVLPPHAFEFGVWNRATERIDVQPIEGVMVAIDNIDPDSPHQREIAFMALGTGESVTDRNLAFISVGLGPDADLSDVQLPERWRQEASPGDREGWRFGQNGGHELGITMPRVILSLLLYLASEHPDIEPVPPAPRRSFTEIRSPKQRAAALANQAERLRNATRLPVLHIGRHLHEEIERERQRVERDIVADGGRTWTLDRPVWVRGHWRQQAYGVGRAQRRLMWIRPHHKGPDMAESIAVQAAKIQRAQQTV